MKVVGATALCGLWASEGPWHFRVTKLAPRRKLRNLNWKSQFSTSYSFRD